MIYFVQGLPAANWMNPTIKSEMATLWMRSLISPSLHRTWKSIGW